MADNGTPMRLHVGVSVSSAEAVVVLAEHRLVLPTSPSEHPRRVWQSMVHSILRPSADIDAVADELAGIAAGMPVERPLFKIMPDGQGASLHQTLRDERNIALSASHGDYARALGRTPFASDRAPWLFPGRGSAQQALLDRLTAARRLGLLRFAAGLRHMDAMKRSLASYDREARDDRSIPPMVGALAVALYSPSTGPEPRVIGRGGDVLPSLAAARGAGTGVAY